MRPRAICKIFGKRLVGCVDKGSRQITGCGAIVGKAFFPSERTKARRYMAEQAKQPQNSQQPTKPQAAPAPPKKVNLDNVLDSLFDTLPMVLDEDAGTITIKTKDFGLMALSFMGLGDIDIFTTFLRRRQQNAKFNQPIEYDQTQG